MSRTASGTEGSTATIPQAHPVPVMRLSGFVENDVMPCTANATILRNGYFDSPATRSLFHGLKLAHNKGHQNALFAGLMHALHSPADVAVSMDADLQDDPGAVGAMVEAWREGAEIVYGVRDNRETPLLCANFRPWNNSGSSLCSARITPHVPSFEPSSTNSTQLRAHGTCRHSTRLKR